MIQATVLQLQHDPFMAGRARQPAGQVVKKHLFCFRRVQRIESGLLDEHLGDRIDPRVIKREQAAISQHFDPLDLCLSGLCEAGQCRGMQTHVDMHRHCIAILPPGCCDGCVHQGDDRQLDIGCDSEQQAKIRRFHTGWYSQHELTGGIGARHAPHLFELATDQVRCAQVAEALVGERC